MIEPYTTRASVRYEGLSETAREAGRCWYPSFRRNTVRPKAHEHGTTEAIYAGVFAGTSPSSAYAANLAIADAVLRGRGQNPATDTFKVMGAHLPAVALVARRVRPTDVLRGPKVSAFYRAIMGLRGQAVVDRHMARVLGDEHGVKARYTLMSDALRAAATLHDEEPNGFQAALWIDERGSGAP